MKKKLNALLLTFCIVFSFVAAVLPVYAVEADGENGVVGATDSVLKAEKLVLNEDDVPEVISFQSAQEKGHILRLRDKEADEYTVVFLNDDNTETMYLFAEPVKYTDEYGNKKDKSTALTLKNNAYTMAENDISVSFPREVANGISISKGDISISMSPVTTTVSDRLTASASPTSCEPSEIYNCTPKDAVEYVTQHTEIPASQYIIILTEEDLTNSNSEGNT